MCANAINALFGAKQRAVLTADVGYEVESVEVYNKTSNEVVPSVLEKTCESPAQWTCTFQQPAGLISIRPKMRPIMYAVVIEECEHCNIVLLEYDDTVNITVESPVAGGEEPNQNSSADMKSEDTGNFNEPQHSTNNEDDNDTLNVGESENGEEENSLQPEADVEVNEEAEDTGFSENVETEEVEAVETENVDAGETETGEVEAEGEAGAHDSIYDAGEFESELEDVEPERISAKVRAERDKSFWQHRRAFDAGQITKEKFEEVQKKHMQFLDDISKGKIIIVNER